MTPSPLTARLRLTRPGFTLAVDLDVPADSVTVLVGPNGAGKSTVLSLVAGLVHPGRDSVITVGARVLADADGVLPAHRRGVGLLAQQPSLFPHMSALDNVAFGLLARGVSRRTARAGARRWLDEVDATGLADRRPGGLSGGQAQRVALARALAVEPVVLLLDEPMAALDVDQRPAMRTLLDRVLTERGRAGRPTLLVTHDLVEVTALADRAVVLADGRVVDSGPVARVLADPADAFTARLAGS